MKVESSGLFLQSEMYAWFQTTVLHVWLCLGRMYAPPVEHREIMTQEMSDHLFSKVLSFFSYFCV
jgi:hypothetical protein